MSPKDMGLLARGRIDFGFLEMRSGLHDFTELAHDLAR